MRDVRNGSTSVQVVVSVTDSVVERIAELIWM